MGQGGNRFRASSQRQTTTSGGLKAFDIWSRQAPGWSEPHPVVIVSHRERAAHKPVVEVVLCSTQTAQRNPDSHEIILDQADGLDWPTLCKCDLIYGVEKKEIKGHRGQVSEARKAPLVRTILAAHGWG